MFDKRVIAHLKLILNVEIICVTSFFLKMQAFESNSNEENGQWSHGLISAVSLIIIQAFKSIYRIINLIFF